MIKRVSHRFLTLMTVIIMLFVPATAVVHADDQEFDILEGDHSEWSKDAGDLYFRIDTSDSVDTVRVDGRTLTPGREYTDYTEDGKRVVRLSVDYLLPSLIDGSHSIIFMFVMGETVESDFNVSGQGEVSPVKVYTVTLEPGAGKGEYFTYRSDIGTISASYDAAGDCQFYYDGDDVCFKLSNDYLPESYEAPSSNYEFVGWSTSGGIKLEVTQIGISAQWQKASAGLQSLSFSEGTLRPAFSPVTTKYELHVNNTGEPISVTAVARPEDPGYVLLSYNGLNTCPSLTDGDILEIMLWDQVEATKYTIKILGIYSITSVIEGKGTVRITGYGNPEKESNTGLAGALHELSAKPADGWIFKGWQLVSGNGSLIDWGPLDARYKIGSDNAVIKAVFEPASDTQISGSFPTVSTGGGTDVNTPKAPEPPSNPSSSAAAVKSPNTGDTGNALPWAAALAASLTGLAIMIFTGKRFSGKQ